MEKDKENEIQRKIRDITKFLGKELPRRTLEYIEALLGMSYDKALKEKPIELFLLLLESYMEYIHYIVMLNELEQIYTDIEVEIRPAFLTPNDIIPIKSLLMEFQSTRVYELYIKLFIRNEGKQTICKLISLVEDEILRRRLARFFLGENYDQFLKQCNY